MFEIEKKAADQARGMAFCGYRDEIARNEGMKAALAVLKDGASRTYDDDLRAEERYQEALRYLEARTGSNVLTGQIRHALNIPQPEARRFTLDHLTTRMIDRHGHAVYFDLPATGKQPGR